MFCRKHRASKRLRALREKFGRLDILVNNAGTSVRKQPQDLTAADWHLVMDTNLTSAFFCSQAAYPHMLRSGGGKIINIGSMMSVFASSYATPYASSKGGIVQMARSMAVAWAKDNIQVNTILPGWIDTDLTRKAREQVPACMRQCHGAHACRALGRPGRLRRHRRVSRLSGVEFRDRRGHSR